MFDMCKTLVRNLFRWVWIGRYKQLQSKAFDSVKDRFIKPPLRDFPFFN